MASSPQLSRWEAASKIKKLRKVVFPRLAVWNYDACEHHNTPDPQCVYQACGGEPYGYQTVAATYHYNARKSLNTSKPGTGKTNMILLTLCLVQLSQKHVKAVVVVPTSAVDQWAHEVGRWTPGFRCAHIPRGASATTRLGYYTGYDLWDVLIVGYHSFTRDKDYIKNIPLTVLVSDDVDPLHNPKNTTHKAIVKVAKQAKWVLVANATPTQTHLLNLFGATVPVDAPLVWGYRQEFERRYVRRTPVWIRVGTDANNNAIMRQTMPVTGYQNMDELTARFALMHIRYTYDQVAADVTLPDVISTDVPLDLTPLQRTRYDELQRGILTLMKDNSQTPHQKFVSALAKFTHGEQVCSGLPALGEPDGRGVSSKLDWAVDNITSSFEDDKIILYSKYKGTIRALQNRLTRAGVGYATIDGSTQDKRGQQEKFWADPACRVMLLSAAGERSLNLQCASVLIMLDGQYNPARVQQIAGRLRRVGSNHSTVRVFRLYTVDTQEERIGRVLSARQVVADAVNGETDDSKLFQALDPDEILRLIRP